MNDIIIVISAWYLMGVIGICIVTYVDSNNDCASSAHLFEMLCASLLGGIALVYSFWVLYYEFKYKKCK